MADDVCARLAHAFVEHFNTRTPDHDLYTDDAIVWNNLTETEQLHSSTSAVSDALREALPDLRWDDIAVKAWDDGFCVQYTFTATLPDGGSVHAPACGIAAVRGDRIARFHEYVDSAQVAPLGQALLRARAHG